MINTKEYYFVTGNVDRQIQDSPKIKWTLAVNSRKSVRTKIFLLQHGRECFYARPKSLQVM